ncbi:hypothetical protein AM2010_2353 [Pelagerythrobacter marensis]|uniref:Lipoprotein n=1 Tax=Pelagerythrobacter marensis TaxID=543877 RepID=A0A0G3XCT3_9SPHN|nr:hypothetical protein AM2010_2353 [Pelagerythrobacter marensis]
MKHVATLLLACLLVAGCNGRTEEPSYFEYAPPLY